MPVLRPVNCNLFCEILLRIMLMSLFCYMETMQPFTRVILRSELENDLMYPHTESFVTGSMLWTVVLTVPCGLTMLAWTLFGDFNDAFEILMAWSLALGINGVLTDMIKLIVGRPRPDFFYRCFPNGVETADMSCPGDPATLAEGRKSFPSGHSSLSFCSLGIASLWACGRLGVLSRGRGHGVRVIVCLMPLVLAAAIALSRSCDYHHHWQDILVGSILGYSVALFCYRQFYNPLSSDLSGIPYIVSANLAKYLNGPDSPAKDTKEEVTPLLNSNGKKDDKWI